MARVGRVIQIDRLIFDTRNKNKRNSILSGFSSSFVQKNESYVFIPVDKIKITRLTHEDIEKPSSSAPAASKSLNEEIVSPIYETIDEKRGDSIDKTHRLETLC